MFVSFDGYGRRNSEFKMLIAMRTVEPYFGPSGNVRLSYSLTEQFSMRHFAFGIVAVKENSRSLTFKSLHRFNLETYP